MPHLQKALSLVANFQRSCKMKKKIILVTIFWLLTSNFLFAQTDATGETSLYEELKKVDNELNLTYKQNLKKLSIDNCKILKKQQRKWIKEKDFICKNDESGGVPENKLRIDCLIQETIKRTKQLKNWKLKR